MNDFHNLSFFDIYEKNALFRGDATALCQGDKSTTFSELFSKTASFASGLKKLDLAPGDRIAVLCRNDAVFFHLFGAASALNLVLVLINRRLSEEEIAHIVDDTTPSIMFADGQMAQQAEKLMGSRSFLRQVITAEGNNEKFTGLYDKDSLGAPVSFKPDDPFIIIHTAAMQGKPRGAVLSQKNVILSNQQIIEAFKIDPSKSYLNILPLFHIMGVNLGLGTLQAGGTNVIIEKFDPLKVLELIEKNRISLFGSFPPILANLLEAARESNFDLSSLETAAGLDMPETVKEWEEVTGSNFWTMYGQTETSGLITFTKYFEKPGSAGAVSMLANIKIGDDFDNLMPAGETGEILVRGPLVFQGYWNADDLNQHTFRGGWHHTGDLGMLDDEGFLYFKGRKAEKELIKPGGENVFPAEVEKAIIQHEAIKDVCVFGVPDKKFGEGIKAVCSLNPGFELSAEELIKFTGTLIAGYKKPRYVEFIDDLPKTQDGSIDRETIKKQYQ